MHSTLKFRSTESVYPHFVCAKFLIRSVFYRVLRVDSVEESNNASAEVANAIIHQARLISDQLRSRPAVDLMPPCLHSFEASRRHSSAEEYKDE